MFDESLFISFTYNYHITDLMQLDCVAVLQFFFYGIAGKRA